jgi:hypothetical protein
MDGMGWDLTANLHQTVIQARQCHKVQGGPVGKSLWAASIMIIYSCQKGGSALNVHPCIDTASLFFRTAEIGILSCSYELECCLAVHMNWNAALLFI